VTAELVVPGDTRLVGADLVTLDGGHATRILQTEAYVAFSVEGVRFVNGNASGVDPGSGGAIRVGWRSTLHAVGCVFEDNQAILEGIEGGGAIYQSNGGAAVIVACDFRRNSAVSGGAIDNLLSPLTIVDSTFVGNTSEEGGGAVYTDGASEEIDDALGGTIYLCGSRFEQNGTVGTGGAVYLWAYPKDLLLIHRCAFVRNETRRPTDGSALGGALRADNAPCQIADSLFSENHADVHGGAYWTRGTYPTQIVNTTFHRNTAGVTGEEGGYGGALSGFSIQVESCTFFENHAEFTGGAISAEEAGWSLHNSVFVGNTSSNEWGLSQTCTGTLRGSGVLQWPAPESDGDPPCSGDVRFEDALLGDLADQGGPTQTMPLPAGSPALDVGEGCPDHDQRGEPRGESCDLGAYERP
jgi:predicted outer membrane repeat protein